MAPKAPSKPQKQRKATQASLPLLASTPTLIKQECKRIQVLLLEKNKAYGDSAISPLRIFSKANRIEGIKQRIDDKLSRIARGKETKKVPEATTDDLIGYLILLNISQRMKD